MDLYILQSDISKGDSRLSSTSAFLIKGIKHAARSITIWLFHLLRPDIDSPPHRLVHCKISVIDVLDKSTALVARICFYINAFEWANHFDIPKSNIPDAVASQVGRHTSHTHPNPQHNRSIFNQHILSATTSHITLVARFGYNHVIKILYCNIVNVPPCPTGINSISVQWKKRNSTYQRQFFQ